MMYTAHQPDLLPYSGFFYKMAKVQGSGVFDLKVWDQFVEKGYQRRVMMRGQWVTMPLVKGSSRDPIFRKRLKPEARGFLADQIVTRYTHAVKKPPFWDKYGPMICDEILSIETDALWDFNFQLILLVRDILGIATPITFSRRASAGLRSSAGIIDVIQAFPPPIEYLSGAGGKSYMGDCQEFTDAGIPVHWSRHHAVTGDSILSVIFDYEDPLSIVLAEDQVETLEGDIA